MLSQLVAKGLLDLRVHHGSTTAAVLRSLAPALLQLTVPVPAKGGGRSRTPSRGAPPLLPGSLPAGWVAKVDPASGKAYYINMVTKERQWHRPSDTGTSSNWVSKVDPASGKTYYVNMRTKETQWQPPSGM